MTKDLPKSLKLKTEHFILKCSKTHNAALVKYLHHMSFKLMTYLPAMLAYSSVELNYPLTQD